jgi:peptidoglycan hydrolase-like protein with peptidoglycan-binding domain
MESGNIMNTIIIKRFAIISLGGIAGGIAGYFLADLIINKILEAEKEFKDEEDINVEVKVGAASKDAGGKVKIDYTKYAEKGDLSELVKTYTKGAVKSKLDNIRIISLDEYDSNQTNKEAISYYAGDTTFCGPNEEIIPNPEEFFGPNVHLHFGEGSEDPDIVYILNENNGTSYEITQFQGKYSVIILGMPDEESKETKGKRRRNTKKVKIVEDEENIDDEGEE